MEGRMNMSHIIWLAVWIGFINASALKNVRDISICMSDDVPTASCGTDQFIITHSALYGRMKVGRCLSAEFGFLGCNNDVMFLVDRWCSGRQKCDSFNIPNNELDVANTECSVDLRAYMQLTFSCVTVAHTGGYHCRNGERVSLTQPEGYISNTITESTGCGSPDAPWRVEAEPGQVILISLLDFAALERSSEATSDYCHHPYAYIIESAVGVNETVCGTHERVRRVYTSATNVVEIHMTPMMRSRYMLHYTFTGCADIELPEGTWMKRDGARAVIGCDVGTDVTWELTCRGYDWEGEIGNCTGIAQMAKSNVEWFNEFKVAILCAVIGFTLMLITLGMGLAVCLIRRKRRRTRQLPHPYEEGAGRSGYATNPYYQPITFDHSQSEKDSNSSDSLQRHRPPPGMSAAMAKSFMPIWQGRGGPNSERNTNNSSNHQNTNNPGGHIVVPSPRRERRQRHASDRTGMDNQRANQKESGPLVRSGSEKCACAKSKSANHHQLQEKAENRKNEQLHKMVKFECEKILARGRSRPSDEHVYASLTKITPPKEKLQMLE